MSEKQTYTKNEIDQDMRRSFAYRNSAERSLDRRKTQKRSRNFGRQAIATVGASVAFIGGAHALGNAIDHETRPASPEAKVVHINVVDQSGQASEIAVHTSDLDAAQRSALAQGEQDGKLP